MPILLYIFIIIINIIIKIKTAPNINKKKYNSLFTTIDSANYYTESESSYFIDKSR